MKVKAKVIAPFFDKHGDMNDPGSTYAAGDVFEGDAVRVGELAAKGLVEPMPAKREGKRDA